VTLAGIVVAAGSGDRFGGPKHRILVDGVSMWERARDLLRDAGADPVVVVGDVPDGVPGGVRRRDSVAAGLAVLGDRAEWVLIHDAARPLASVALARRVADRLGEGDVDGVVPTVPVRDTLKRVEDGMVAGTVDRDRLVAVQTPQGYRVAALREAQALDGDATDEAVLLERAGRRVATVEGEAANLKVTYPGDLALVAALTGGRR
jgi:2-C-methyl-D-erythritol 4-phosphate cytidylyltransferase